ncbi:hypothetical protein EC968_006650 [Mortierella alpina]|nr:hypothetical protein EC968_006650 [Mortierella alpina]
MADQAGMYAGAAVGIIALLGIGAAILYRKHQQDLKDMAAREQVVQERMQHVVDMNLPPFYVDHELDPVCIYEHELPLDAIPPVQPILVHSPSDEHIIPPEDDPLASSPTVRPPLPRELSSSFRFPSSSSSTNNLEQQVGNEAVSPSSATSPTADHVDAAQETLHSPTLSVQVANMPTPPAPAALLSPALEAAAGSPRLINEEMLNLARLPAPPSYHVPNRVIDRSPHHHPHSHHQHSYSASDASQLTGPSRIRDDYFGAVRIRSHTFSHPPPQQQQQQQQRTRQDQEEDLPPTPRYSLEFPSHVPHQRHLEQYRRARAQHARGAPTCPSSPMVPQSVFDSDASAGPQAFRMQERSYSQPYDPTWSMSNSSLEDGLGPRRQQQQRRPGTPRSRASTIGESSKLLMQRMQVLWKKTNGSASTLNSPYVSGQNSLNASTIHVDDRQGDGSSIVGLGMDQDLSAVERAQNHPEEDTTAAAAAVVEEVPAVATFDSDDFVDGHGTMPDLEDQALQPTTLPPTDPIPTLPLHAMSLPLAVS